MTPKDCISRTIRAGLAPRLYPIARHARKALIAAAAAAGGAALAQTPDLGFAPRTLDQSSYVFPTAEAGDIRVDVVVRGLNHPFSLAFTPAGDALITERGTSLRLVRAATADAVLEPDPVAGLPPAGEFRGAGIHEVAVDPDFAENRAIYYTYNRPGELPADGAPDARPPLALIVMRGRLDGHRVVGAEEILDAGERAGASGSRIAFGPDDTLYITTGAPFGPEAQQLGNPYGKVLRIRRDGSIPQDNPFIATAGARAEVYTIGHRDQLGLTVHRASGTVFAAEHGPNGGDEVNLILPGRNYGWPDYSFGRDYEGPRISSQPTAPGIELPAVLWIPSIGPSGMTFYDGDRIPEWHGNLFVGSSRHGEIPGTGGLERVVMNDNFEELRRESLLGQLHLRIRDVRQGPDGLLYVITDEDDGALLRLAPAL